MEVLYFILGVPLVLGTAVALYEWRSKRVLLQHDLSKGSGEGAFTEAERIRAEGVVYHNPTSGMY